MSFARRERVTVTTNGSGAATAYTNAVNGLLKQIIYTKTDFADGVDFTITTETTAQNLWVDTNINASEKVAPREAAHDTTGAGVTFDGTNEIYCEIPIASERIKIVIASGGDTKTGTFDFILE